MHMYTGMQAFNKQLNRMLSIFLPRSLFVFIEVVLKRFQTNDLFNVYAIKVSFSLMK